MLNQKERPNWTSSGSIAFLSVLFLISVSSGRVYAQNANANRSGNSNANASAAPNANRDVVANTNTTAIPAANAPKPTCPEPDKLRTISVTEAYRSTRTGEEKEPSNIGRLGDELTVVVEGLPVLLQKAQCTNPSKKILLFLDGRPVKDVNPFPPTDPEKQRLIFPLKRTEASREVWTYILGEPSWSLRKTGVSVGIEDEYAVNSAASIELEVIPHGYFIFWAFLFVLLVIGFLALAIKSDVLRDSGLPPPGGARKAYSLSRCQAAWWFFIILASYLLIGIITGDFSTSITGTVLVLLGISVGTAVGSSVIDAGRDAAPSVGSPPATVTPPGQAPPSEYWWLDILSDANGVSFHRFQNAVWTLVLGIIFATQVYKVLAMPTFDATLLGLMGISAGGYLAMKIPEPK